MKTNIRERLIALMQSVDNLTLRERAFVFVAALAIIGGAWEAFLAGPLSAREAAARAQIEAARQRLTQLDSALELAAQGIGDGMSGHLTRVTDLRRQLETGEETIRVFTSDLIDPTRMRLVLEDLLKRQRGLTLIRAANLEVQPLIETDPATDGPVPEDAPMLYRHGFVLEVEGAYLDCLAYLADVEQLPWQLFWHNLRLDSSDHPRSRVVIELYTLSLEEEWIGV